MDSVPCMSFTVRRPSMISRVTCHMIPLSSNFSLKALSKHYYYLAICLVLLMFLDDDETRTNWNLWYTIDTVEDVL